MKVSREQFLQSNHLQVQVIDLEKKLMHHNRFIIDVVLDRSAGRLKKKYSDIRKFGQEVEKKLGIKEFLLGNHMRSSDQYRSIQTVFKNMNSGYLTFKEKYEAKKTIELRSLLYNALFKSPQGSTSDFSDEQNGKEEEPSYQIEQKQIKNNEDLLQLNETIQLSTRMSLAERKIPPMETRRSLVETGAQFVQAKMPEKIEMMQAPETIMPLSETKRSVFSMKSHSSTKDSTSIRGTLKKMYEALKDSSEDTSPLKEILKSIKTIWLLEGDRWIEKQYQLEDNLLIMYSKQCSKKVLVLSGIIVNLEEQQNIQITLMHNLSKTKLALRMSPLFSQGHHNSLNDKYLAFYTRLKEISQKHSLPPIRNLIRIGLTAKKSKLMDTDKKAAKQLLIKISHEALHFQFSMLVDSTAEIDLVILNNYGIITLEVTEIRELILLPTFREYSQTYSTSLQCVYDCLYNDKPKKKESAQISSFQFVTKTSSYMINLRYASNAKELSYCLAGEVEEWQGKQKPKVFTREQMRIQKNRFRRIAWSIESYVGIVRNILHFEYPLQSYSFYLMLLSLILFVDANMALHYFIVLLILLMAYCHPSMQIWIKEIITLTHLNDSIKRFWSVWTAKGEPSEAKVRLRKDVQKQNFLSSFDMVSKKKINVYKKYKRLQQVLLKGQLYLNQFVSICEKIKNIFVWYHHRKTKFIFAILIGALLVISFVPVRVLLVFGLYKLLKNGLCHKRKTNEVNRMIVSEVLHICIEENGLEEMRQYELQKLRILDKKHNDYITFERKAKDYLQNILEIDYDHLGLFGRARTLQELVQQLANCNKRYLLSVEICEKYGLNVEWATNPSSLRKILLLVYGFILNVPSDRNILGEIVPPVPVEKIVSEEESEDSD